MGAPTLHCPPAATQASWPVVLDAEHAANSIAKKRDATITRPSAAAVDIKNISSHRCHIDQWRRDVDAVVDVGVIGGELYQNRPALFGTTTDSTFRRAPRKP
jgi:hypothetical protein